MHYQMNQHGELESVLVNPVKTERLFVYGIFLGQGNRDDYGMKNPRYATVADYATVGGYIVQAMHVPGAGLSLTGLTVDVPVTSWGRLDMLESGYDRIKVRTHSGEEVFMYARPVRDK